MNLKRPTELAIAVIAVILALILMMTYLKSYETTTNIQTKQVESNIQSQQSQQLERKKSIEKLPPPPRVVAQKSIEKLPPPPRVLAPLANKDLKPPGDAPAIEEFERIWNYVYYRQYDCAENMYLGGKVANGDGAYSLCTEERFWPKKRYPNYKCLMYSFGIGGDFSFDDEMANLGCEVHSFDPSTKLEDGLVRDSGVTFHKVGISEEDNDHGFNGWKMRTLKTIIKELGHTNRYLDYLKVDTDKSDGTGFEDTVMEEVLKTGLHKCIRQYSMEIHMANPQTSPETLQRCRKLYDQMAQLNKVGWRLYNTTDNVRAAQSTNPAYTQRDSRNNMLKSTGGVILWEPAFVNFNVESVCDME